ncbi:hypothetical protein BRADI_1g26765v3 [Brachypodium distachyon]|uniref:Uncharacterized protein n=1 Tax=Brachypodium distachyon TaxID=15368 RepID=A0A0Q3KY56_BRADI|nr:hypothetical protein BRADI_1g26765v3 [Brachypodium distachyon]
MNNVGIDDPVSLHNQRGAKNTCQAGINISSIKTTQRGARAVRSTLLDGSHLRQSAFVKHLGEPLQRSLRRAALADGLAAHISHHGGLLPRLPPLLAAAHQGLHRPLQLRCLDKVVPLPVHLERHRDAHVGHELERVEVLLRVQRPRRHGHAVPQALQHRVPPAVGHEPAHGGMRQDLLLRRPRRPDEDPTRRPLQEPLREELVQVRVRRVLRPVRRAGARVRAGRASEDPQEAVGAAPLERRADLNYLCRLKPAHAPEAEEHHRRPWLRVEPGDARVRRPGGGFLLATTATEREHGADGVHGRRGASGHGATFGDGRERARLELVRGVRDDPRGVHEALPEAHEPRVVGALLVHHGARHPLVRYRRQPGHVHDSSLHFLELHGHRLVEHGQVEHEREHGARGRHEHVGGHAEVLGHVHHGRREQVEHERGDGAGHAGHGVPDARRVELDVPRDELLDSGSVGGGLDGGEAVDADVEARGRLAADVRLDLGGGRGGGRAHHEERDGEGAAAAEEDALAGLEHGHEVPRAPLREENQRGWRRHRSVDSLLVCRCLTACRTVLNWLIQQGLL